MIDTDLNIITTKQTSDMFIKQEGLFTKGFRVHCPLKAFAPRRTKFCLGCEHFKGVIKRTLKGEYDPRDPRIIMKLYRVACSHPVSRGIMFVPED